MKRFFVILIAIALVLMISCSAFAASMGMKASMSVDASNTTALNVIPIPVYLNNAWFTVKPEKANLNGYFMSADPVTIYGVQYFKNDHTYLSASLFGTPSDSVFIASGSYLFDFGLFVGGMLFSESGTSEIILAPGYRLNLDDQSYIAAKIYYDIYDGSGEFSGVHVELKYYTDNLFVQGEARNSTSSGTTYIRGGANYQINDTLTAGLRYLNAGSSSAYEGGVTWGEESGLLINGALGQDSNNNSYFDVSGMFAIGDHFAVGGQYDNYTSSNMAFYQVKGEYRADKFKVGLTYINSNSGSSNGSFLLTGRMNLK